MPDEPPEGSDPRWLTAGDASPNGWAGCLAVVLFFGSIALFDWVLGDRGVGWVWIPALGAVLLGIPLYFLLRRGDRTLNRWWARRGPTTRMWLRRAGWWAVSLPLGSLGVWFLWGDHEWKRPEWEHTGGGVFLIGLGLFYAGRALRERRRGI